ncbi:MAG TPA: hypothetical protein VFL55_04535 [Acetobacteraceae bacterium]|jgi:hypothetical protein|nr:hypothetical protein [Acetobacteraceae bacterium]
MPMIDIVVTPQHATRIFFDCRDVAPEPAEQKHIAQVIERSIALAMAETQEVETLPLAA